MIHTDRCALLCDMAETYSVYDLGSLPLLTVAALASGLRENSRIKMKMTGAKAPDELLLLAHAVDRLSILVWQNTKDAQHGRNKPAMIADLIINGDKKKHIKSKTFKTADEFWEARKKIIEGRS